MASFTFYSAIPQPGNNPSISQGQILQNFTSIGDPDGSWVTQDHYGFGTGTDGEHKQITFAGNNPPTVPTSPPVLFTQNDAHSLPQLFFYTGTAAQSMNQYEAASSGSVMLMGGMILKWGNGVTGASNNVTFSPAFPNAAFSIVATTQGSGTQVNVTSLNATNATITANGFVTVAFYYIAIGN